MRPIGLFLLCVTSACTTPAVDDAELAGDGSIDSGFESADDAGGDGAEALSLSTSGVTVLESDDSDVTAPLGLLTTLLPTVDIAPALLVEISSYSSTTGSITLLTAWGELSSAMMSSGYRQSSGPTMSCSGTTSSGSYSTSCGSAGWMDMEGTTMYLGGSSGTLGATLYSPALNGDIATSGGTLYLSDATLSGRLDLSTLREETGLSTTALCALVGGCGTCPGVYRATCVDFSVGVLDGSLDTSLDIVAH